ncbi:hypothetical protein DMB66_23940 [Actinoplanes sp. ATCC 53533]|nr:hypothetical protein DMB66_23940 [Actinoplanes sp. ATCC 53533]
MPLFVSDTRLRSYRRLPQASCRWALDSGAYSQLLRNGGWADGPTPHQYAARVRRYAAEVGRLDWAATQDWLTDPALLARTGLPVRRHVELTVASYLELASIDDTLPFIPILQGWLPGDYEACAALYERHGVNLRQAPMVGVGSVAHRQGTVEAANIIAAVRQLGISRIHTFGVKTLGLRRFGDDIYSSDSLAWSFAGRYRQAQPGCAHRGRCGNCRRWALQWRRGLLAECDPAHRPTAA